MTIFVDPILFQKKKKTKTKSGFDLELLESIYPTKASSGRCINSSSTSAAAALSKSLETMAALTRFTKPSSLSFSNISKAFYFYSSSSADAAHHNPHPQIHNLTRKDPKDRNVQWVFLGCPGVGKGTYASRLSKFLGVPHIATGDLVREELASSGPMSHQVVELDVNSMISYHFVNKAGISTNSELPVRNMIGLWLLATSHDLLVFDAKTCLI
ncbi:hypothetical protein Patl1_32004 [Pistacia atlantica]|uniref:Uncharacterized protein n=1 Tax=Pistacia atlantica TaxID=434234 RepID=A0ACC1ARN5_9ROSI|nr:hypothetical protein Patl1_32004 [Pistacia atlantica]